MKYVIDSSEFEWREAPAPLIRYGKVLHDGVKNPELTNLSFGIFIFKPGQYGLAHKHSVETEVFYTTKGMGTLVIDGKKYEVKAGTLAIVPPEIEHYPVNDGNIDWEYLVIFTPSFDMSFVDQWQPLPNNKNNYYNLPVR